MVAAVCGSGMLTFSRVVAPTFFRVAVVDIAELDRGFGAGRAGALAAGSC